MQYEVSKIITTGGKTSGGLGKLFVTAVTADIFETDSGLRPGGKLGWLQKRHEGVCFYAIDKSLWGDDRRLVAFFPGTDWVVEEK